MQLMSFLKFINCSVLPSNFLAFVTFLDVTLGKVAFIDYLPNLIRLALPLNFTRYEEQEESRFHNPFLNDSTFSWSSLLLNYELKLLFFLYLSFLISPLLIAKCISRRNKKAYALFSKCTSCALFWRLSISLFMELAFLSLFSLSKVTLLNLSCLSPLLSMASTSSY